MTASFWIIALGDEWGRFDLVDWLFLLFLVAVVVVAVVVLRRIVRVAETLQKEMVELQKETNRLLQELVNRR